MNKQKLIDKAVSALNGKLMRSDDEIVIMDNWTKTFVSLKLKAGDDDHTYVCSASEFTQRARELGYCNGYKYSIEYETNGKKPDLHPSVIVQVRIKGAKHFGEPLTIFEIIHWDKPNGSFHPFSFRIVDPRYKPVEVERAQADNSLKVGETVSFPSGGGVVVIADEDKNGVIIVKDDSGEYRRVARAVVERKADEERRKFVDAALACLTEFRSANQVFSELYDAGCRFTKNKAAS